MFGTRLMEYLDAVLRWADRHRLALRRVVTFAAIIVAVPALLVWLLPHLLVWFAPPLDTSKDLYSVNRPSRLHLPRRGRPRCRPSRRAWSATGCTLDRDAGLSAAAFIAMEDRSFYINNGIDPRGLLRADVDQHPRRRVVAGGSTITQQTAKIVFTSQERTYARKLSELVDAAALEKSLSKKQILELYLNRIYLGSGAYGVDGAARVYFGKSRAHVSLAEAAMLATLTTRAVRIFAAPRSGRGAGARRRSCCARWWRRARSPRTGRDARAIPPSSVDTTDGRRAQFLSRHRGRRSAKLVSADGTAPPSSDLDRPHHARARAAGSRAPRGRRVLNAKGAKMHASEAAVVLMKTDGAVSALIGGRDYDASAFNRATQAHRQPGSAFKPFVYLAAVENGISPWDVRDDGPVDIDGWTPTNFGGRTYGTVTLADALAHSINTVTASLAQEVGISSVVEAAQRCGITRRWNRMLRSRSAHPKSRRWN
jgi:penicillin-binding protein 1A